MASARSSGRLVSIAMSTSECWWKRRGARHGTENAGGTNAELTVVRIEQGDGFREETLPLVLQAVGSTYDGFVQQVGIKGHLSNIAG